jgi:hypothetical protein
MHPEEGFVFTGSAVAFGARLDQPRIREVRGSLTLPDIGGRADAHEPGVDLGIVRIRAAHASATGDGYIYEKNRGNTEYETRVACTVEGFELANAVRADYVSATLVSTFIEHHRFREETVTLRGLWADRKDQPVERRTPPALEFDCTNLQELIERAKAEKQLVHDPRQLLSVRGQPSPDAGKVALVNGRLVCYLLEPNYIPFEMPNGDRYEVFLGEYVLDHDRRRLSMMRIEAKASRGGGGKRKGGDRDDLSRGDQGGRDDSEDKSPDGTVTVVQPLVNGHRPP